MSDESVIVCDWDDQYHRPLQQVSDNPFVQGFDAVCGDFNPHDAEKVSEEEAKERGLTPCSECYGDE